MFPCNVLFFPFSAQTGSCHYLFLGNVLIFPFNVQKGSCHYLFPGNVLIFPFYVRTGSCHYLFPGNVLIFPFNAQTGSCHCLFPDNVLTYPFNTETHSSTRNVFFIVSTVVLCSSVPPTLRSTTPTMCSSGNPRCTTGAIRTARRLPTTGIWMARWPELPTPTSSATDLSSPDPSVCTVPTGTWVCVPTATSRSAQFSVVVFTIWFYSC